MPRCATRESPVLERRLRTTRQALSRHKRATLRCACVVSLSEGRKECPCVVCVVVPQVCFFLWLALRCHGRQRESRGTVCVPSTPNLLDVAHAGSRADCSLLVCTLVSRPHAAPQGMCDNLMINALKLLGKPTHKDGDSPVNMVGTRLAGQKGRVRTTGRAQEVNRM